MIASKAFRHRLLSSSKECWSSGANSSGSIHRKRCSAGNNNKA